MSGPVMEKIGALIRVAMSPDCALAERHEAFSKVVLRFQDMAFGYAHALLGDSYLAEDAAQEAFITAWGRLHQLQQPDAFPGWFRRIVLTQCNRLTRGKRLEFVPLNIGESLASTASDPHVIAEKLELVDRVLAEIKRLPEHERMVTTLFYVNEYSQVEISTFLELPVSTIGKRLFSARQRLRERMLEMFKDNLREHRPSRNKVFADQVSAKLRPFDEQDWMPITGLAYSLEPDFRGQNDMWLRNRQEFDETRYIRRHYVAEHGETRDILGYGSIEQSIFRPNYRLFLIVDPKWLRRGVGDLLIERLMADLRAVDAITVWHRNYAQLPDVLSFLIERGFSETRRVSDLRLPTSEADLTRIAPVIAQVASMGIEITTLAEECSHNPEALRKLHEFLNEVKADDPQRQPYTPAPFASAVQWMERPFVLPDACFIARHGERYVGFSDLILLEALPGGVSFGFTGVAREYRRQGIATALKARAIEYAREHDYSSIRTWATASQSAALALARKLGFEQSFCYVTVEKCLKEVAEVDPRIYDTYVGQYAPRYQLVAAIKRDGDKLVGEIGDQRVEFLPESETEFFVKAHGRVIFVKDEKGNLSYLLFREADRPRHTIEVDPRVYDSYVGEYPFHFDFLVNVAKEGGKLYSHCVGQKTELIPESETEYFIKEFYGSVQFFKDETGQVSHLIHREWGNNENEHEVQAVKIK
jgi:RNA polymerase sigma factor (sigma-70 family)